ncbi:MAG TPA: SRPBCC family protein [Gemmatimonadales bacterium]|nr:SRPBCC family protein [Gemmatimonadales bacterium]
MIARLGILTYGVAAYLIGVVALVALIVASLGLLPLTGGPVHLVHPSGAALFDLGLLALFGVQHSVMARPAFKAWWTRIIPPSLERSTYLVATAAVLLPLVLLWQPLPGTAWSVGSPALRAALTGVALLGWAYLFAATFAIDHLELFGLRQSWDGFRGRATEAPRFRERWMYRFDRHPIMTGLLVGVWAVPEMTAGHLLLALGLTAYVVVGVRFEERALVRQLGEVYESYRRRVPALVPTVWGRAAGREAYTVTTRIAARPEQVWAHLADVLRWPDWLPTVRSVMPLGPRPLALGARYRVLQPKLPAATWTVTALEPGRGFTWESRSPGVRVVAEHRLQPLPGAATSLTLEIRFSGPLAALARALGGPITKDYLAREASCLKWRAETEA